MAWAYAYDDADECEADEESGEVRVGGCGLGKGSVEVFGAREGGEGMERKA